jgi:hypothetical protein
VARKPERTAEAATDPYPEDGMTRQMTAALEWKREYLADLRARITIEEAVLRSLRTSYAELNQIEGRDLALRYGWESAEDIERVMAGKREFQERIENLFCAAELMGQDFFEACKAVG